MALEIQKLQREHDFNPILLPRRCFAQVPVFIGLYHVLMSFNRTQTGFSRLGLSVEQNRELPNATSSAPPTSVTSWMPTSSGAPIGASMTQQHGLDAFTVQPAGGRRVSIPLMLLRRHRHLLQQSGVRSRARRPGGGRQPADRLDEQAALYVFPLSVIVGDPSRPSRSSSLGVQQHPDLRSATPGLRRIEKEEEAKKRRRWRAAPPNAPLPEPPVKDAKGAAEAAQLMSDGDDAALEDDGPDADSAPRAGGGAGSEALTGARPNAAQKRKTLASERRRHHDRDRDRGPGTRAGTRWQNSGPGRPFGRGG